MCSSSIERQESQQDPLLAAADSYSYRLTLPRHSEVTKELHFHDPTADPRLTRSLIVLMWLPLGHVSHASGPDSLRQA